MKKFVFILLPFLFLTSCASVYDVYAHPSTEGNMVYVFAKKTGSKEIPFCSTDLTVYLDYEWAYSRSDFRYTIGVKKTEKADLEKLNVDLLIGSETIKLIHRTMYDKKFKRNGVMIRFESRLDAETSRKLVENEGPLLLHFYNEDESFDSIVNLEKFQKKVNLVQRHVL